MLPNYPHHVVQRGHNRQVVFVEPGDYQRYLDTLAEFKLVFGVKVYAYCLMTNHVHLLLAPGEEVAGLGRLMKRLAGRQTRYHNALEAKDGDAVGESLQVQPRRYRRISAGMRPLH